MQTDPNWSNFLFNKATDQVSTASRTRRVAPNPRSRSQIELIDFGATRAYSQEFIDRFLALLIAAVDEDREACLKYSHELGYLIGGEHEVRRRS